MTGQGQEEDELEALDLLQCGTGFCSPFRLILLRFDRMLVWADCRVSFGDALCVVGRAVEKKEERMNKAWAVSVLSKKVIAREVSFRGAISAR